MELIGFTIVRQITRRSSPYKILDWKDPSLTLPSPRDTPKPQERRRARTSRDTHRRGIGRQRDWLSHHQAKYRGAVNRETVRAVVAVADFTADRGRRGMSGHAELGVIRAIQKPFLADLLSRIRQLE